MARSRGLTVVAVVFVTALLASACGSSSAHYVKNADLGVYLKVPESWTVFTLEDGGPVVLPWVVDNKPVVLKWSVGFDSSPQATRSRLDPRVIPFVPTGEIDVTPALGLDLPSHTNEALRAMLTGQKFDATTGSYTPRPAGLEVSEDKDVEFSSGHFGVLVTTKEPVPVVGGETVLKKQTSLAYFDSATLFVFLLQVGCEAVCYDSNQGAIRGIVDSLTMKKPA